MTFLELVQMVGRESGTVSGNVPSSVSGQTGRLSKIVHWTDMAWRDIQNKRASWLWMRDEFEGTTTAGEATYTAASFGISRWAAWINEPDTVTVYRESDGVADERPILFMPWTLYRRTYRRGEQQQNRPLHYTISPAGEFCIGPKPDGAYVLQGEYRKSPQTLSNNSDVPEMPARFHELIGWYGLLLLVEHDEAQLHIATAMRRYRDLMSELQRDQLPQLHIAAEPLA